MPALRANRTNQQVTPGRASEAKLKRPVIQINSHS
jgi:hypothetical protein